MTGSYHGCSRSALDAFVPTASRRQLLAGMAGAAFGLFLAGSRRTGSAIASAQPADLSALGELLRFVPAPMIAARPDNDLAWTYSDFAQQLAALEIPQEVGNSADLPEGFVNALFTLAPGSSIYEFALVEELQDAIGFEPLRVHQALRAGAPPEMLTLLRGGIDMGQLPAAWLASGYEENAAADGTPIWTIGRDGGFGFERPIQRTMLAKLNNVAILDDTLVYGTHFSIVEAALATYATGEDNATGDPVFGPITETLPGNLVSAIALFPEALSTEHLGEPDQRAEIEDRFAASDAEVGAMPVLQGMTLGITAGLAVAPRDEEAATPPPPDRAAGEGLVLVHLTSDSTVAAEQAAQVLEHRWNSWPSVSMGVPYAELMDLTSASTEDTIVTLTFVQAGNPGAWRKLVDNHDLLPFLVEP
jgi:hypothetical protein